MKYLEPYKSDDCDTVPPSGLLVVQKSRIASIVSVNTPIRQLTLWGQDKLGIIRAKIFMFYVSYAGYNSTV